MKIVIIYIVVILVAIGLGYFLFQSSNDQNPETLPGQAIEVMNQEHIAEGSTDHPAYNSNPPTSGWHWPAAGKCLAFDSPQIDERVIHNLEHGAVWISYRSSVDDQTKAQLKDFAARYGNVVVSPRDTNENPISLAAWGRLMHLDSYDESKILEFIHAFMDKGPERVPCAH